MRMDMCCCLIPRSGASSMHLTYQQLLIASRREGDSTLREHCTRIYFVERERERNKLSRKTKNMRKLFRCYCRHLICSSSARDLPVALEGNMKIKQQRARVRESVRAHLSRSPTSYLPRGISPTATSSAWTAALKADACLPACLAVLESSV